MPSSAHQGAVHEHDANPRRLPGGRLGRVPPERGHRHLSDHAFLEHGRALGRMGGPRPAQHLGHGAAGLGDAVRGRRSGRSARRSPGGRPVDDVHRVAGPAAHDPQHVQDRGRADTLRDARLGAHRGHARPVDLRRPVRRHDLPFHRLRHAGGGLGPGGAGLRRDRARRDAQGAHSVSALLRRLPHFARSGEDRGSLGRRPALAHRRAGDRRAPLARPVSRPSGDARHGAEPRRVLPGARSLQLVLRRLSGNRARGNEALRRAHRAALQAVRLRRPSAGRARDHHDGLGRGNGARTGRLDGGARREGGRPEGAPLPTLRGAGFPRRAAQDRPRYRGPRPHQGAGRDRRPALSGRDRRAAQRRRRRRAAAARERRGRALRALVQGIHARHGQERVRRAGEREAAPPLHRGHRRRRDAPVAAAGFRIRHRAPGCGARGVLRPGRGRDRRREQEFDQDHRRGNRPVRAGLLRLRLEEIGRDHHFAPALRPAADPVELPHPARQLRRRAPVELLRALRRAGDGDAGRHAARQFAVRARQALGRAAARSAGTNHRAGAEGLYGGRPRCGSPGRHGRAHQHGHADLLLRAGEDLPARGGDRLHQAPDQEDLRRQGRRRGEEELRRRRRFARAPARDRGARKRRPRRSSCRPSFPTGRPISSSG